MLAASEICHLELGANPFLLLQPPGLRARREHRQATTRPGWPPPWRPPCSVSLPETESCPPRQPPPWMAHGPEKGPPFSSPVTIVHDLLDEVHDLWHVLANAG